VQLESAISQFDVPSEGKTDATGQSACRPFPLDLQCRLRCAHTLWMCAHTHEAKVGVAKGHGRVRAAVENSPALEPDLAEGLGRDDDLSRFLDSAELEPHEVNPCREPAVPARQTRRGGDGPPPVAGK
jgi:hypothetical protein